MEIEFDKAKSEQNARNRGLPFDMVVKLDWHSAVVWLDARKDYKENRWSALVPMGTAFILSVYMKVSISY